MRPISLYLLGNLIRRRRRAALSAFNLCMAPSDCRQLLSNFNVPISVYFDKMCALDMYIVGGAYTMYILCIYVASL